MTERVWRKSSYSTTQGGECVEVSRFAEFVGVRDSKNPAARLALSGGVFAGLLSHLKRSVLDG